MAVNRGNGVEFEGCVIDLYERNGSWDSDFYAVCWDEEKQRVVKVMYDTTRFGGYGEAEIDATEETIRAAFRYFKNEARNRFDGGINEMIAKTVRVGDEVEVVRGRKIPNGTVGKVFWVGKRYNYYSHTDEERVGIMKEDGEKIFISLEYVSVVGWSDRLMHGRKRKTYIRNMAVREMPVHYQEMLMRGAVA